MSYLEELLPEFRKGAKIRCNDWSDEVFVYTKDGRIFQNHSSLDCYEDLDSDLISDKWEFYQEHIDWDYIIKNKCLCWFWDEGELPVISKLVCFDSSFKYKFTDERNHDWKNCRPVRRDEVTFYEDKKDVL